MPTLDFKGKQHIYAHHLTVPYRPIEPDETRSCNPSGTDDNLIIQGDNLHALKALLPRYANRIKCIYIDPPYNTGNEGWMYNDNVNSPLMQKWLEENGPVDNEDLERHDKWLCMMWPRLHLLHELLADDGVIFISIDDNEQHHLRMLMDEIFGAGTFVASITWKKRGSAPNDKNIGATHEFILVYCKNGELKSVVKRKHRTGKQLARYKNPDNHPKGVWAPDNLMANVKGGRYVESLYYPIVNPDTGEQHYPSSNGNWRFNKERVDELLANKEIYFGISGKGRPKLKRFLCDVKQGIPYGTIWDDTPLANKGTNEIQNIFGNVNMFDTPKPEGLIKQIITMSTNSDSIILDSFAGSGTTGHATLALNKEDGGNRKFILVECEDYADTITAERVRRVINGVPNAKDESLREGLGGSFTYCTLGKPIEIEGMLTGEALPPYESLAAHLLYTTTGASVGASELEPKTDDGLFHGDDKQDYYMLYKPDLEYLLSNESMLNLERAERIHNASCQNGKKAIVYGPGKYMPQKMLTEMGITFCQLPHALYGR